MEPEWTKGIKSKTMCDYYYILFVINAIACAIAVIVGIPSMVMMPNIGSPIFKLTNLIFTLAAIAITFFTALFIYLLCDRTLVVTGKQ